MTMSELHRTPKPFLVGVEDSDGDVNWFQIISTSPLDSMCQADLYQSLKDTLSLNYDDDFTVIDMKAVPTVQHRRMPD